MKYADLFRKVLIAEIMFKLMYAYMLACMFIWIENIVETLQVIFTENLNSNNITIAYQYEPWRSLGGSLDQMWSTLRFHRLIKSLIKNFGAMEQYAL